MSVEVSAKQSEQQNHSPAEQGTRRRPANPFAAKVARLRAVLFEVINEAALRRILLKLCALAEQGNIAAIRLILSHVVGRPDRPLDIDPSEVPEATPEEARQQERQERQLKRLEQLAAFDFDASALGGAMPTDDQLRTLLREIVKSPSAVEEVAGDQRR